MTIPEFITARLGEDERYLRSNRRHLWTDRPVREVANKRLALILHNRVHDCPVVIPVSDPERFDDGMYVSTEHIGEGETCTTLRSVASVWNDHDDYRPEWAEEQP